MPDDNSAFARLNPARPGKCRLQIFNYLFIIGGYRTAGFQKKPAVLHLPKFGNKGSPLFCGNDVHKRSANWII